MQGRRNPTDIANVARVVIGEAPLAAAARSSSARVVEVLEAQIDDMPGEWIPALLDALFDAGAIDATASPVLMKKGRPGLLVRALATTARADAVSEAFLRHSTTFGVRRYRATRDVLEREHVAVQTPYGEVRIKVGRRRGAITQASPEHADCAARAREAGAPLADVYAAARAAWATLGVTP